MLGAQAEISRGLADSTETWRKKGRIIEEVVHGISRVGILWDTSGLPGWRLLLNYGLRQAKDTNSILKVRVRT
jgi:hypothetical protein